MTCKRDEELNRRRWDDLTVIGDILWFEQGDLLLKEHCN